MDKIHQMNELLLSLRRLWGLSADPSLHQRKLATRLRIPYSTVRKWSLSEVVPQVESFLRIAQSLNASTEMMHQYLTGEASVEDVYATIPRRQIDLKNKTIQEIHLEVEALAAEVRARLPLTEGSTLLIQSALTGLSPDQQRDCLWHATQTLWGSGSDSGMLTIQQLLIRKIGVWCYTADKRAPLEELEESLGLNSGALPSILAGREPTSDEIAKLSRSLKKPDGTHWSEEELKFIFNNDSRNT
jgi:transcriptional regulator with XRE-family HTH domain